MPSPPPLPPSLGLTVILPYVFEHLLDHGSLRDIASLIQICKTSQEIYRQQVAVVEHVKVLKQILYIVNLQLGDSRRYKSGMEFIYKGVVLQVTFRNLQCFTLDDRVTLLEFIIRIRGKNQVTELLPTDFLNISLAFTALYSCLPQTIRYISRTNSLGRFRQKKVCCQYVLKGNGANWGFPDPVDIDGYFASVPPIKQNNFNEVFCSINGARSNNERLQKFQMISPKINV